MTVPYQFIGRWAVRAASAMALTAAFVAAAPAIQAAPVTTHPRLWITAADLPKLRGWAVDSNPMYKNGL